MEEFMEREKLDNNFNDVKFDQVNEIFNNNESLYLAKKLAINECLDDNDYINARILLNEIKNMNNNE